MNVRSPTTEVCLKSCISHNVIGNFHCQAYSLLFVPLLLPPPVVTVLVLDIITRHFRVGRCRALRKSLNNHGLVTT